MSNRFTVTVEEDEFGEYILPIPDEICEELGWNVGDTLNYELEGDCFTLRKVENDERSSN